MDKQTQYKSEKVNNLKYSKTKLPWFSCFLQVIQHSARKRGGLILQRPRAHTGQYCQGTRPGTETFLNAGGRLTKTGQTTNVFDTFLNVFYFFFWRADRGLPVNHFSQRLVVHRDAFLQLVWTGLQLLLLLLPTRVMTTPMRRRSADSSWAPSFYKARPCM